MNKVFQPQKGFGDLLGSALAKHEYVLNTCYQLAKLAQFERVVLPVVETFATYAKPFALLDLTKSDFFTLNAKSRQVSVPLVLRPELTSGLIRAYLNHPLWCQKAQTVVTSGPCFRYEKPQKGRFRQFTQWNFEQLRTENSDLPNAFAFLARLLERLKLTNNLEIIINFLTPAKLANFSAALQKFSPVIRKQFCLNCQARFALKSNLYRIFDCQTCQPHWKTHIKAAALLTRSEQTEFTQIQTWLKHFFPKLPIRHDPFLVRGLNYYEGFVFEVKFHHRSLKWAQNTLLAGGQYQLKSFFLHRLTTTGRGFGFALGVERFVLALEALNRFDTALAVSSDLVVIGTTTATARFAIYQLQTQLHTANYVTIVLPNLQHFQQLQTTAVAKNARYLIVFDEKYQQTQTVLCKKLSATANLRAQIYCQPQEVLAFLKNG